MSAFAAMRRSLDGSPQKPGTNPQASNSTLGSKNQKFEHKMIDLASLKIARQGEGIQAFI